MQNKMQPILLGWLIRDALIVSIFALMAVSLSHYGAWTSLLGFLTAYIVIYAAHEWGHWLGARLTGGHMPFASYKSALIGYFDPSQHTTNQFLALSWGGVLGYLTMSGIMIFLYFTNNAWFTAGAAVAGLAFVVQSLAVDLPQIFQVQRGADPVVANQLGTEPKLILTRTLQTWLPLSALLALWHVA